MQEFLDILGYGGIVSVIGLFIVFLGLAILIACITAMAGIFKASEKRKASAKSDAQPPVAEASATVEAVPSVPDDGELIAVIAAAIAAMGGESKSLVVRSVRRVSGWNKAARAEQVNRF